MRWPTASSTASRAGSLLSHPPLPALPHKLLTPQPAPGCVAHTHSGLPRALRGGTRRHHNRNGTRTPRVSASRHPRHAPTRMPRSCTWPPCAAHDRHRDTCNTPTAAPPAPRVARTSGGRLRPRTTRCPRTDQTRRSGLAQHRSERQIAPAAVHHKNHSPAPVGQSQCPSTALRRGPSGAADPHLHSELRHALHTARTRPPETRTCAAGRARLPPASRTHARCSHRVDAQTAHGRCWRRNGSGVGG